jgi:hypothetical protein
MGDRKYDGPKALPHKRLSDMRFSQRRAFVHRDVVGLVALDFILWILRAGVMRVSLVVGIFCMNLDDLAAYMAGFRVPRHVIANFEFRSHDGLPSVIAIYTLDGTAGVTPSLQVDYKSSRTKQYHKEGRALRTATTINNTRGFAIRKRPHNLPALRSIGFQANRRLLDVQTVSHDCAIGEDAFDQVVRRIEVGGQRATALRFGDARTQALLNALVMFSVQTQGFTNAQLRTHLASLLGIPPSTTVRGV